MWDKEKAKKTFCPLAWNHLATNTRSQLRLCCNSTSGINLLRDKNKNTIHLYNLKDKSILNNNPTLNKIRKQMLSGQKPLQCKRCFKEEAVGTSSARISYAKTYPILDQSIQTTNADGSTTHRIQYVDLRMGNLCNLRCRMCNPFTSNQLVKEFLDLNIISKKTGKWLRKSEHNNKNLWGFLSEHLEEIEMLYLAGGEPTLITEQITFLDNCIKNGLAKNINLKYSINATNIPPKFFSYWKEFKAVILNCSIDGVGKINEYIRNPSNWNIVHRNLQTLEKHLNIHPNWRSNIHTTVQVYNITHLVNLFEYLKPYKRVVNFPSLNLLITPPYFSIKTLPKSLKKIISSELLEWFNNNLNSYVNTPAYAPNKIPRIPQLIKFMNAEDWSEYNPKFKFYTEFYDKNRNENFAELNPKLKEWYKTI